MRYLILILTILLASCGKSPKKIYIRDMMDLTPEVKDQFIEAVNELNAAAGETFISFSGGGLGDKPVDVRQISAADINNNASPSETIAHARYEEYHCLMEIRTDIEDVVRRQINPASPSSVTTAQWHEGLQRVIMHELGHCYGLGHVNDSYNIMNPTYSAFWDNQSIAEHATRLKDRSKK